MKILVVDDNDFVRTMIAETLRAAGYETEESADGGSAIAKLEDDGAAYGLVITDIVMPLQSGLAVAGHIAGSGLDVPVLAISSYDEGERGASVLRLARSVAEETLGKPVSKDELLAAVARLARPDKTA